MALGWIQAGIALYGIYQGSKGQKKAEASANEARALDAQATEAALAFLDAGQEEAAAELLKWAGFTEKAVNSALRRMRVILQPYHDAGVRALGDLQVAYDSLTNISEDALQSSAYKFRVGEAQKAVSRSAAAKGAFMSGAFLTDLQSRIGAEASQEYENEFRRRYDTANLALGRSELGFRAGYGAGQLELQGANIKAGAFQTFGTNLAALKSGVNEANIVTGSAANQANIALSLGSLQNQAAVNRGEQVADIFSSLNLGNNQISQQDQARQNYWDSYWDDYSLTQSRQPVNINPHTG